MMANIGFERLIIKDLRLEKKPTRTRERKTKFLHSFAIRSKL
jgi:hypothetical protein